MTQNKVNTSSRIVQFVSGSTTSVITGSTAIPFDDTIPQSGEGNEVLTLAITPKSAASILLIEFSCENRPAVDTTYGTLALFQDANANALTAAARRNLADNSLRYVMTSGTTSSTTFKVRAGKDAGTALYVNADNTGAAQMGGVMSAWLTITEFL